MMKFLRIIIKFFIILFVILTILCTGLVVYILIDDNSSDKIVCTDKVNEISINGKEKLILTINLCEDRLKKYTIETDVLDIGSEDKFIRINTPKEYKIKKVERILYWYPTIWSSEKIKTKYSLVQYIQLKDLQHQTTEILDVIKKDTNVDSEIDSHFDQRHLTYGNHIDDNSDEDKIYYNNHYNTYDNVFLYTTPNINKLNLKRLKQLNKQRLKKSLSLLKTEEKNEWLKYLSMFRKGIFFDRSNRIFELHYFDIYIKITFQGEKGDYVRVLHQKRQIGN